MEAMSDIPCVILAGGRGTRLSEETSTIPKPMLMVGDKPLLQHVMDIYIRQGVWNFIIPVGYKSEIVRAWFLGQPGLLYFTNDHRGGTQFKFEDYTVTVVDTGLDTQTGGRIYRVRHLLNYSETFHFTYGDGVANVDLSALYTQHTGDTLVTLTAVHPVGRFGRLEFNRYYGSKKEDASQVLAFGEKIESESDWINGGFALLSTRLMLGITGDQTNLEKDIYPVVARYGLMKAHRHTGFWRCVDTLRDLEELRSLYKSEDAPWLKLSSPGAQGS